MDITDIIIAKALAGGGGGSSLPEVTSADEGKVLAVNASGEWAASTNGFIIYDAEHDNIGLSYNQLTDMVNIGVIPHFVLSSEEGIAIYQLTAMGPEEGRYFATFVGAIDNVLVFSSATADGILSGD